MLRQLRVIACMSLCAACAAPPVVTSTMEVRGAQLPYTIEGQGPTIVLVHGALSDLRTWEPHRQALAQRGYRVVSYTQRYFGSEPWQSTWPPFGIDALTADLAAFVGALRVGPVHLVSWSFGGQAVLQLALNNPELVKSAFVFEPAHATWVTDPNDLKSLGEDVVKYIGPVVQALKAGDSQLAAERLVDGVADRTGYFAAMPSQARRLIRDNARTMPLMFLDYNKHVPAIGCQDLKRIKSPIAFARGESTRAVFRIIADSAARCAPASIHVVVAGQGHMWPAEDSSGFASRVSAFLDGVR